ncbi:MAG TPA: prevent-host-death protein [Gammaproteobacteria bacterium]|nr:prevent-host-death protein [Gammaproteobacteria bacterium]MBK83380.1 prevent-host-death protein [Gammaproteobacteria bacterium]HBF08086.1 prevent-host-death protein [Gammaproteobacteria bacterium]HCK91717.1 prevent-host-death protein [Gammaproteobacteria bacterium]|tara:strand:- start:2621 stop:2875 length:255 start_codon:yes stop_codon:yes gene_type:complete
MTITTLTSREFNQDIGTAKRASMQGPVFITDRGHVAHVFLTIDEYLTLTGKQGSIVDLLAMPDLADVEFEPPKINTIFNPVDFS